MSRPLAWFISGWSHPAAAMEPLAHELADVFEGRCFGLHEPPLGGAASPADALTRLMLGAERTPELVCGWSTGALAAVEAAARVPRPPRLALISGTARFFAGADRPVGMPAAQLRALRAGIRRDAGAALAGFDGACGCASNVSGARWIAASESLLRGLDYLAAADARNALRGLSSRILWIHGGEDRIIPVETARADARPGDRVVIEAGAGHALPLRNPRACAIAIRDGWAAP